MPDRLESYRRKRRFDETPEPSDEGAATEGELRFVVHEHHATRLHWDLRLEHDGTLASWAVPNGIPQDPKHNRKAVQTEDHPLSYLDFEAVIPKGNYGAGKISIWDRGTFELEKWRKDEIIVVFHGERLQGKYVLFQAGKEGKDWLMHRMDPPLDPDAEPIPERIEAMLATPGVLPAREDEWAFEVKWDGVRAMVRSEPGRLHLFGRSGKEITTNYPELHHLNRALSSHSAILDGEIVAFDEEGKQSFEAVQHRIHQTSKSTIQRLARENPVTLMIFDLLWLDGHSLVDLPYEERRSLLDELDLAGGDHWNVPAFHVGDGTALLQATAEQDLEGIIAKRLGSAYEPGARAQNWRKIKNTRRQEVVIAGITPGRGRRAGSFGAVQVGVYDEAGELRYAGGVGSGFTETTLKQVLEEAEGLDVDASPFAGERQPPKETRLLSPELVCEVEFMEWSRDGSLRHPTFKGLRFDKDPREIRRELQAFPVESEPRTAAETPAETQPQAEAEGSAPDPAAAEPPANHETPAISAGSIEVDGKTVKLTNLDKVLYPGPRVTKSDVIRYYAEISHVLIPHLAGRPVTLVRFPDGVEGKSFFEKHANRYRPDWVKTIRMSAGENTEIDFVEVADVATLLWTANLAALELHPSLSHLPDLNQPTALVFDLDPGPPATIVECCHVATLIRELLTQLSVECWAKTSGSKGLQLYAPLNVDVTYDDTKPFAQAVATLLEQRHPELIVSKQKKTLRPGKVLIDWSQNDRHKTTVGVYSLRARDLPTVSTPVTWDEVEACAEEGDPLALRFDKDAVLARVDEHGDLFEPVLTRKQELPVLG